MSPWVRQSITDLLELSADSLGFRWMAVVLAESPEPVVYPTEDHDRITSYLRSKNESLPELVANISAAAGEIFSYAELESTNAADPMPACFTAIGLSDCFGNPQGALIVLAPHRESLTDQQQQAMTRIARLTERCQETGAIVDASEQAKADLERFRKTLDSTRDCVFMFDADHLRFFYVNQGAVDQLGYSRNELLTLHPFDIKPLYSRNSFRVLILPLVRGQVSSLDFETLHRHKDGHDIPVNVSLQYVAFEAEAPRFVAIVRDITEQRRHQQEIERMAYFDALTGLPNRRFIRKRLESAMAASSESGCFSAVMLSDLDDFKAVNDTLGHRHGDELLIEISSRFASVLGEIASLSRLGGDEFLFVLDTGEQDHKAAVQAATAAARKLLGAAIAPTKTLGNSRSVSTSIGIVLFQDASTSASELMRMADIAMYDAKRKGKNNFSTFDQVMQQALLDEHELTVDLNVALGRDLEIVPWFQPKIDRDGRFNGFEALVRWHHPDRGLLNPGDFIELAERKNLMAPLSDRVLTQACQQMSLWRQRFAIDDWTVSVNISQSQLAMRDFPEKVAEVLADTGLPASALVLEITETVVAENILHSIRQMELIRATGVRFSLDDFGTGYSSLDYLRQLPIDELKIDKSFVDSILDDEEGHAIIRAILALAHSLKLVVVAEGIETEAQWQALTALGCEGFQGYLFSRPQPGASIAQDLDRLGLIRNPTGTR